MLNVMIDLETAASNNNAGIFSIGAVAFHNDRINTVEDFRAYSFGAFYRVIDLNSQREGFSIEAPSIYWWLKQSQEARREILRDDKIIIRRALMEFTEWYKSFSPPPVTPDAKSIGIPTYSYGATFDHVILQNAYNVLRLRNPIHYRSQVCMRTVVNLAGIPCPQLEGLVGHNALDDAIRQAIWIQTCFKKLHGSE